MKTLGFRHLTKFFQWSNWKVTVWDLKSWLLSPSSIEILGRQDVIHPVLEGIFPRGQEAISPLPLYFPGTLHPILLSQLAPALSSPCHRKEHLDYVCGSLNHIIIRFRPKRYNIGRMDPSLSCPFEENCV